MIRRRVLIFLAVVVAGAIVYQVSQRPREKPVTGKANRATLEEKTFKRLESFGQ